MAALLYFFNDTSMKHSITSALLFGSIFILTTGFIARQLTQIKADQNPQQQQSPIHFIPLAGPTLSADAIQPSYTGTSSPMLNIIAGSGKTAYVSAVLNDPTDPAATTGIVFTLSDSNAVLNAGSNNQSVVNNSNVLITVAGNKRTVRIIPNGIGYATISLVASNSGGNSSTYKISYAASTASLNPAYTFYHSNSSDASGVSVIDSNYMFVADDENNFIRLYNRNHSGKELYSLDITSAVGASAECDLEGSSGSVKYNAGKRLYWIGSLGNNKSGALKADRNKVIATEVNGTGATSTLTVKSYSNQMRSALINWGDAQGWNFTAAAASGMIPKRIDGFNVEGLSITQGGDTAYIGFRAPCVPVKGTTPTTANRKFAVVAPVVNFETILNGNGNVSTTPVTGEPILFDLAGLGIRSIERVGNGSYLIVAGLFTGGGSPAVYLWDGIVPPNSGKTPITVNSPVSKLVRLNLAGLQDLVQTSSDGALEGHPEAMVVDTAANEMRIALISDDGTLDYYNDGTEAKSLSHDEHKKFRDDKFVISTDSVYGPVINLCPNYSSTQLACNLTGTSYAWQWDTCGNGCYTSITDNVNFTGSNSKYLSISNMPTSWAGYTFRCKADEVNSNAYTIKFSLNWTGAIDNNWETPGNWDCNHLPDEFTDVLIKSGAPVLHSSTTVRSLMLGNSANLTINTGNNLTTKH